MRLYYSKKQVGKHWEEHRPIPKVPPAVKVAVLLATLWLVSTPKQANAQFSEYEIKAALCFNFAKYISWPERLFEREGNKIILSIYGSDPFGEAIDRVMRGRTLKGKYRIEVRRALSLRDLRGSHIIFISRSEKLEARKIIEYTKRFKNPSILTIGDNIAGFCESGGIINLMDNYTFHVNPKKADNSGLLLDSRLINIAVKKISTKEW